MDEQELKRRAALSDLISEVPLERRFDVTMVLERVDVWLGFVIVALVCLAAGTVLGVVVGLMLCSHK